jgi:hypothetical protein
MVARVYASLGWEKFPYRCWNLISDGFLLNSGIGDFNACICVIYKPSESNQGSSILYVYELGHPVSEYEDDFAIA